MTSITVTQEAVYALASATTPKVKSTQSVVYVLVTTRAAFLKSTQEVVYAIANSPTPKVKLTQEFLYALSLKLADTRSARAWYFHMDGHDFYVLTLGQEETLVYDLTTDQWSVWASPDRNIWRPMLGMNWDNEIVGGDATDGTIYNITPETRMDYLTTPIFNVVTGFIGHRGRDYLPCYGVTLLATQGDPESAQCQVSLRISDDMGKSFLNMGTFLTTEVGKIDYDLSWYSLGQIGQPGRIFQIIDQGYATIIYALEFLEQPK